MIDLGIGLILLQEFLKYKASKNWNFCFLYF
jgi:hypothetical protein